MAPRVLVVEDDDIARSFLADILRAEGYEVDEAEDGGKAFEIVEKRLPDLVLSDVLMPHVSGVDLFRRLQSRERYQSIPFIFLTCLDDGDTRLDIEELGPDDYLAKPVRPRQLLAIVRGKLRRQQAREERTERELDKVRDRIRCTLSHELRTPLTVIQAVSDLLMDDSEASVPEEYQDLLESLRSQSFRLGMLVENFLLVSRIDSGAEEDAWKRYAATQPTESLLEDALASWSEKSRELGVELEVSIANGLPAVHANRQQVQDALYQILDNAFKFADRSCARVEVAAFADGDAVQIDVSDNGRGIPEERRDAVFAKLAQLDRDVHEQQGSGLGLYIAKALVEVNRGAIGVDKTRDGGTRVSIRLPLAADTSAVAPDHRPPTGERSDAPEGEATEVPQLEFLPAE